MAKMRWFWFWAIASIIFRIFLIYFPKNLNLISRPEVATPLTSLRRLAEGYWLKQSSMSPYADFFTAMLIRVTGQKLQLSYNQSLKSLNLKELIETSSIAPLAAFGWVAATHLSLYPAILVLPVILLLGYGPDVPPRKLFLQTNPRSKGSSHAPRAHLFSWKPVIYFILWASIWSLYVLLLCSISLKQYGGLPEMFKKTYGFILKVEDLSPNIGVLWSGISLQKFLTFSEISS
ncbi:hypothetical protein GIB67_028336 [Kingdonia uniflora]|uniref:Uncharacterized protein n=1 Tax=Kingdonia uniflora TaxID=39325 RepID=A0A7J7MI44_9MAGN|nr:hypothetical protein GIB67_028336 [Kingdonia uniflora]